jgi:putative nucleotidyltransferase with HDIG domain
MVQEKIRQLITNKIKTLPTLPTIIQKVVALAKDEKTSARDLCKLISYDQAISFKLLKIANSAYYGFLREVSTIQHAIVILGFDEVKRISMGIAVVDLMKMTDDESPLNWEEFWKHSVGCSLAASIICKKVSSNAEIASTASLLHDIGKLVLNNFYTSEYRKVLEKTEVEETSLVEAEKEMLGFTHADVGMWLSNKWKLPPSLTFPIAYHHQVGEVDQEYLLLTSIIHLADMLCKKAGIGHSGDTTIPHLQESANKCLCIKEEDIERMIGEIQKEEEKTRIFINSIL